MARSGKEPQLREPSSSRSPRYPYTVRLDDRWVVSRHRSYNRAVRAAERLRRSAAARGQHCQYWVWDEVRGRHVNYQGWGYAPRGSNTWYMGFPQFPGGHPSRRHGEPDQ